MMKKILLLCCASLSLFCYAKNENQAFQDIHPYAFYYLSGSDYRLSDINYPIVGVNASKLKINKHSQELKNKKVRRFDYKNALGYNRMKADGTCYGEYFFFSVYKKLASQNYFIVKSVDYGGGTLTCVSHLLIKKYRKNYYDSGKIKVIDVLTCEGDLGKNTPSNKKIEKVEKFIKQKPKPEEIKSSRKQPFQNIHPYAFYYLSGGDYRLKDTERGVISINASKFKLDVKSNEICHKTTYIKDNKIGFTYEPNSLAKEKKHLEKDDFYIVVYKKLSNLNYYIVKCIFTRDNNVPRVDYLLIRKYYKYYYYWDKFVVMEVLTCDGDFGNQAPSEKKIKKVEKLISKKIIGDIPTINRYN
jgi:hypothetical protein